MRVFLAHTPDAFERYYGPAALAALGRAGAVVRNPTGMVLDSAALVAQAQGCEVIVADRQTPVPASAFAGLPDLVAVVRCAMDIRTIDVEAASAAGVLVTRASPGFVDSVVELGIGFLVDLARGIGAASAAYRRREKPEVRVGMQLAGSTLGIVGYGAIGRRFSAVAHALGMTVLACDPHVAEFAGYVEAVGFDVLLSRSDFVVCLAPVTDRTRHLFGRDAFACMRPGARFVNLARGELVDEAALVAALDSGHLGGAAIDVGMAPDQMPSAELAARPDVVATPHIGGLTPAATQHQAFDTVRQVAALAAGRIPEGAVNASAAHRLGRLGVPQPAAG
jgi:D-3-phosphoglycerate dehydrogenase